MILSVSRRTDIPAFYSEWFMNRIREGNVCVRNPFNANQISRVNIKPEVVDCIVFWTKNPRPLIDKLHELDTLNYKYYFQFTITPYHNDLEVSINDKNEIINTFIELSNKIGKEKVILRYDPILITERYTIDFHVKAFAALCERLHKHTRKIIISFLDDYKKISKNMKNLKVKELNKEDMTEISKKLVNIANEYNLGIETCAEGIELSGIGINHARCIDGELIEEIIKYKIINKDKLDANRKDCGCMKCIDIGQYDSCVHNCLYCYATINKEYALANFKEHDPNSPILIGKYDEELAKDRKDVKTYRVNHAECKEGNGKQLSIFDNM